MTRFNRFTVATVAILSTFAAPALAKTNFAAHLSGSEQVPVRETRATGQANFTLNPGGSALEFRINTSNIENVIAAQIQLGAPGTTGPVVAMLFGPVAAGSGKQTGVLASGTITAANLVGTLAGQPLSALISEMEAGRAYVNVLTDDGQGAPDEKPGDFSSGEIRGQVR